jgi:hypothetical protein
MSNWDWLKDRPQRLAAGSLDVLLADVSYCRIRTELAPLKSQKREWEQRRRQAEQAIAERYGNVALAEPLGTRRFSHRHA